MRVATYNVHGCVGMDRQRSESRIADVIASMSVDVVGLQELDLNRRRSASVDQAALIAAQLGWKVLFSPAMRQADEQYGDAILSRWPLRVRRIIELPGEGVWFCREKRIAIWAEVETPLGAVQIINTHFGLGRSERLRQAQYLASREVLGEVAASEPVVLLGDFNSLPGSRAHRFLTSSGLRDSRALLPAPTPCRTYPTRLPVLAVDHIFVNPALHPLRLEVHRAAPARIASDHFPMWAELARG